MRIISFLFKSLIAIGIIGVVFGLIAREALLVWGISQLQSDLKMLRSVVNEGTHQRQCVERGAALVEGQLIATAQLRFESDTDYVLEIACDQFRRAPIVLKENSLPMFVSKISGMSGVVLESELSGVTIEVFGRRQTVMVQTTSIRTGGQGLPASGNGPQTSCVGYGFICCEAETSVGVGQQNSQATDCSQSCFSSCQRRPVLLSLTAEPYIDLRERVARVVGGQELVVNYTVEPGASQHLVVLIDFGDGEVEQLETAQGSASHLYQCSSSRCTYTVRLSVQDDLGVSAAELPHHTFGVVVQN